MCVSYGVQGSSVWRVGTGSVMHPVLYKGRCPHGPCVKDRGEALVQAELCSPHVYGKTLTLNPRMWLYLEMGL